MLCVIHLEQFVRRRHDPHYSGRILTSRHPVSRKYIATFHAGQPLVNIMCWIWKEFLNTRETNSATDDTELIIDIEMNIVEQMRVIGISEHFSLCCLSTHYTMA